MELNFRKWESHGSCGAENFRSYYKKVYEPLLDRLSDSRSGLGENDRNIIRFLHDDMDDIFLVKEG